MLFLGGHVVVKNGGTEHPSSRSQSGMVLQSRPQSWLVVAVEVAMVGRVPMAPLVEKLTCRARPSQEGHSGLLNLCYIS